MTKTTLIDRCLCCDGEVERLIGFGPMLLANTYSVTERFDLSLNRCATCSHLQLAESVNPSILFSDYVYCSGTSRTALDFFDEFARMCAEAVPGATTALDIACNDGTQLDAFKRLGMVTTGIDPAENLCRVAENNGHQIICSMFENVNFHESRTFDIITAQNVLAHTPTPLKFMQNCRRMMHFGTRLFVTASQAEMVQSGQCDTLYHEHISYFNTLSIAQLATRAGLRLLDVQLHPIHGTSYIFVFGISGAMQASVSHQLMREAMDGLFCGKTYDRWLDKMRERLFAFRERVKQLRADGYKVVGCGAAAKGITTLNMARVTLDHLFDTTPTKWGKIASGMLIQPFEEIANLNCEKVAFIILAWNFEEEVTRNVKSWRDVESDVFVTTR